MSEVIGAASRPHQRPGVKSRWTESQASLFNENTGHLHLLNATAFAIWELCDGETEVREMVDAIEQITGREAAGVEREVIGVLSELRRLDLLDVS